MILLVKFCVFLFCIAVSPSRADDRCNLDQECRDIATCDEKKFFQDRNLVEILKLKVCGKSAGTKDYCCKKLMMSPLDLHSKTDEPLLSEHKFYKQINHKKCGFASADRIKGGSVAKIGSMPWMVLLSYESNFDGTTEFKCGGSLITPKFVLTAAHCIEVRNFKLVSVRLGEHRISTAIDCANPEIKSTCLKDDPPIQDIAVDQVFVHEDFARSSENDIALIRLKTEADFVNKKAVGTICLPTSFNQTIEVVLKEEPEILMTVAGWGRSEENPKTISDVLRYVDLPYVPNEECDQESEKLMCAGGKGNADACRGDSGGPLTCFAENDKGQYRVYQQGIVSRGVPCSSSDIAPGIYVRVFPYMKWILDHLEP